MTAFLLVTAGDAGSTVLGAFLHQSPDGQPLFHFEENAVRRFISQTSQKLGLESLHLHFHELRHGGPSTDVLEGSLSLAEIQRRGRWKSPASVRRYEKHGRLSAQLARLSAKAETHGGPRQRSAAWSSSPRFWVTFAAERSFVCGLLQRRRRQWILPGSIRGSTPLWLSLLSIIINHTCDFFTHPTATRDNPYLLHIE
jgi:hypothetical protein